jgi:NMD protein affecting ribosome stability and mRNA decay
MAKRSERMMRHDRLVQEREHDPYRQPRQLPSATSCPECGAVFARGRWSWPREEQPITGEELCPACRRLRDRYPAGLVVLRGEFLEQHYDEVAHLVTHQASLESAEHPLSRIIDVERRPREMVVTTTDIHLPRRIGEAIHRAYGGNLDFAYAESEDMLRVSWSREA